MMAQAGQWIAVICCLAALIGWWKSKYPVRHDALILFGILVYFGIGTLNLFGGRSGPGPRYAITPDVWVVVGVGGLAYFLGAILGRQRPAGTMFSHRGDARSALRTSAMLSVVGWAGLAILLVASRFPLISGVGREQSHGYFTALSLFLVPAFLLRFAAKHDHLQRRDWWLLGLAVFLFLLTGYRSYALVLGLSVAVLRLLDSRSFGARVRVVLAAMAFTFLAGPAFGYLRFTRISNPSLTRMVSEVESTIDEKSGELPGSKAAPKASMSAAAAYTYVGFFREGPALLGMLIEEHPARTPYGKGTALVSMLTSPLPGVQDDARTIISKELYGSRRTSLVSTIFGPWYLDFGLVGVVTVLALMGYVMSWLERRAVERGDLQSRAGYAYGLVIMALSIHSGLSDFSYIVLIPLLFLWAATGRRLLPAALRGPKPAVHQTAHD